MLSASRIDQAELCGSSVLLPQVEVVGDAFRARGKARHLFLAMIAEVGREGAPEMVPAEFREECGRIEIDQLPIGLDDYDTEVTYAYDPETNQARRLGRLLDRNYGDCRPREIPGTLDVVSSREVSIHQGFELVADYNGSWSPVTVAKRNRQLLFGALGFPREPHSVKPEHFHDLAEEAIPSGVYLELFARRPPRNGRWAAWGNEIDSTFDFMPTARASR